MTDKETVSVYASNAEDYADLPLSKDQIEGLDLFCAALPDGGHVLDLGCGPGIQAAELKQRGFTVEAIDPTPEFVMAAEKRGVSARIGTFDDLAEIDLYDGIWASFSLLHARKADFPRHIAACKRAIRPGGCLYLGLKLGTGEQRDSMGRFYAYYTKAELENILSENGFGRLQSVTGEGKGLAGTIDPYILMIAYA